MLPRFFVVLVVPVGERRLSGVPKPLVVPVGEQRALLGKPDFDSASSSWLTTCHR